MHRILVVDDDPINTKLLKFLLSDEGYEVTVIHSPTEALTAVEQHDYDLVFLDVMMPEMDGLELCRRIRAVSTTPIIFVSARGEINDKVIGLKAGAIDYISKPYDPNELLAHTWAALSNRHQFVPTESSLKTADLILNPVDNKVTLARTGKTVSLTPIEARLLRVLLSNPGRTLTRDTLVIKVWGYEYEGESNQLDVYIKRLRSKIEENPSEPQLLRTMRGVGYKFQPSDLPLHPVEAEGTLGVHHVDCAASRSAPVPVRPTFVYPVNRQTLDYGRSYLFKVEPIAGAAGYLWGFFQGGTMVWENLRDEGTLSTTEYGIHPGSTAHSRLQHGTVEVWVRASIRGSWTEATTITIHLT